MTQTQILERLEWLAQWGDAELCTDLAVAAAAEIRRLQAELDELRAPHTSHVTIPERFYVEMKSNNTV